jgi:orotate phosphoribosyltransferase
MRLRPFSFADFRTRLGPSLNGGDCSMSDTEARLLQLLKERSFKRGTFRLASGDVSDYYIDGKMTQVFSEAAHLIGEVIYEHTKDLVIDAIGGLEVGAVPLTTAAVISYHLHGRKMEGFWVRDKAKTHGTQKVVEGNLKPGSRVVILDDVITRGSSSVKAIEGVRQIGCEIVSVIALVDRLQGAAELFSQHGIQNFRPIFTIRDFGVEAPSAVPHDDGATSSRVD